tara:strand:- start:7531 stop:8358 length:828 start_codon:yes stop_codon:yes gene_type:complete
MPTKTSDISSISLGSGWVSRSKKEELSYDHPGYFHEYVFKQKIAAFHWEVYELLLEAHKNPQSVSNPFLFLAPRNHAKTSIAAENFPLWLVGLNNRELCQVICSVVGLARKRLKRIERCIKHNRRYKQLFGDLYPDDPDYTWSVDELEVLTDRSQAWETGTEERDPTFAAMGITTSVEGGRATYQAYDDIVTAENVKTETGRAETSKKFWMSFMPMLQPEGQVVVTGTRYHYADLYEELVAAWDSEKMYTDLYPPKIVTVDGVTDEMTDGGIEAA